MHRFRTLALVSACCLPVAGAHAANGGTVTYKVGSSATVSTTAAGPYSFGALSTPTSVSFSDIGIGVGAFEDVFVFALGNTNLASVVGGSQLDLSTFSASADITSLRLENLNTMTVLPTMPGSANGVFVLPTMGVAAGTYALMVDGVVKPGSVSAFGASAAQFSGSLVTTTSAGTVSAVPEPRMPALLSLGLGVLGLAALRKRKLQPVVRRTGLA